ncbi:uncharacterized protein LOC130718359 isoform X2 [Lotus japonicus]|uniref:uncharacterized protein LOC130718359 isoform X2 n=1 Tax=Lotus japonicus TaxID=34305 RepID=UPI002588A4EF|nr:uncharacterized protein LOC130718359 isoform X2 [Lotus japonicus]
MSDSDPSESSSSLPWLWVIEALAGFKGISISALQGLIDLAPVGPDDLGESTRELVALRCLEELSAASVQGVNHLDASSTLDFRAGFDFSRSCEDVLREIFHEIQLSDLEMAGEMVLKSNIPPFIMHKRASTVKCQLEQLKESILEGTLPLTDYLKERSGLFQSNRGYTVHENDRECNDHLERDDGNPTDAENREAEENSVPLILENGNKSPAEQIVDNNFLPSKRNRFYSADEHLTEKQVGGNECDDYLRNTKRTKCHGSTSVLSMKEKLVSQLGKEVSKNSTEKRSHQTEKNNRETLCNRSLEDNHNRYTASNLCTVNCHNEVFHDESNIPCNATVIPLHESGGKNSPQQPVEAIPKNVVFPDGMMYHKISECQTWSKHDTDSNDSQQTVASDKFQDDISNGCGIEISSDRFVSEGDKNNLMKKKHEENFSDMKRKKGSQLLVCEATTVPSVAPQSCLDSTLNVCPQHVSRVESCQNTSMDEIDDTVHVEPIPTIDNNANNIQLMIDESQPEQKEPSVKSLHTSQQPVASNKTVIGTVNGCAAKKYEYLCSRYTLGRDLPAMTESTEQNLCMKCNEGGKLMVCKTTTCQLMMHKNCLGASCQLDANGNVFCPFCAYSHTISEYLEAKKKASLARKELAFFISRGISNQPAERVHEFSRHERSLSRKSRKCEHIHIKNNGSDPLTRSCENRGYHVGERTNEVNNLHFERSQQQASKSRVHSSCRVKENVNNGLADDVTREEDGGKMPNAKSLTGGKVEGKEGPSDHIDKHEGGCFSCKRPNIVPGNQSCAGEQVPKNMTKQHNMGAMVEPDCAHDTGKAEISEGECEKHSISRDSTSFHKQEVQFKSQATPQSRRKKIPWTAEEEELIQEGVQKFGCNDQNIPWKKIWAFGSHVFEQDGKRRMPQDLKDKWKNMCKAHSKQK